MYTPLGLAGAHVTMNKPIVIVIVIVTPVRPHTLVQNVLYIYIHRCDLTVFSFFFSFFSDSGEAQVRSHVAWRQRYHTLWYRMAHTLAHRKAQSLAGYTLAYGLAHTLAHTLAHSASLFSYCGTLRVSLSLSLSLSLVL